MKKTWKIISIILVIVVAFTGYKVWKNKKNKPEWKTEEVRMSSIRELVTASGTINPVSSVEVGTEVSGKIEKVYKDYNQTVKKGDLLAKIDTETLELNLQEVSSSLQSAEASAKDARIDVQLLKELVKKNMAAEYDLQKAEVKLEQAEESVNRAKLSYQKAKKNLDNAYIYSPIDGVIISRNVEEGQTVAASLNAPTLFVIANDLKDMQIDSSVDEADIGKINLGMPVFFTVDAFAEERFMGKVKQVRLQPANESNVITYTVIIGISNPDMLLLPGMTANVSIVVNQKEEILTVSSRALQFKPSKEVWESFGLTWSDTLLARSRGRGMGSMPSMGTTMTASKTNTSAKENFKSKDKNTTNTKTEVTKEQNSEKKPRMTREEFEKLSPEERQKFREKFGRNRGEGMRRGEAQETESTVKKVQNSESVDVFKLRGAYSSNRTQRGRVWVLENNVPKAIMVETGITDGNTVEIISGLKEGQQIISGVLNNNNGNSSQKNSMMPMGGMGPR
jgi:HlyD family secretion protein